MSEQPATDLRASERDQRSFLRRILVPVVGALVSLLILYSVTALLKSRWTDNVGWDLHLVLTQGRDILAALIVGVVLGWAIVRESPALLLPSAVDDQVSASDPGGDRIRLYIHAQWFIAMRWVATLVTGVLVYISIPILGLLPRESLMPLIIITMIIGSTNFCYVYGLRKQWNPKHLLIVQAYVDLLLLTILLHFSGGLENPLSGLMVFHVIIGGIILAYRECYRIATVGSILYALLAFGEASGALPHYGLELISYRSLFSQVSPVALHTPYAASLVLLHAVILFLSAYFVSTLAERLRNKEQSLAMMAQRTEADRRLLIQALESTNTGLRVLMPDLTPSWTNVRWREWFGTSSADGVSTIAGANECIAGDAVHVHELQRRGTSDSREQVFQITTAPVRDSKDAIIRVVQLAHDITMQKESSKQMMRAGQMAAVGELAGQIAHEVNNPIAIISAKARILLSNRRSEMSDKIAAELEKITGLSQRVARIAQGLLSYCRPSPASRLRLDIRQPIRTSLTMVEERAATIGISVIDHLPKRPVWVIANAGEMEQVFLNLFLNAIQAMSSGGSLTISVEQRDGARLDESTQDRQMAGIVIDDTGPGIPRELRDRVFEPFFTTKTEVQGTGLGLSICQGLVRGHGGSITISDSPSGGARFKVYLPVDEH